MDIHCTLYLKQFYCSLCSTCPFIQSATSTVNYRNNKRAIKAPASQYYTYPGSLLSSSLTLTDASENLQLNVNTISEYRRNYSYQPLIIIIVVHPRTSWSLRPPRLSIQFPLCYFAVLDPLNIQYFKLLFLLFLYHSLTQPVERWLKCTWIVLISGDLPTPKRPNQTVTREYKRNTQTHTGPEINPAQLLSTILVASQLDNYYDDWPMITWKRQQQQQLARQITQFDLSTNWPTEVGRRLPAHLRIASTSIGHYSQSVSVAKGVSAVSVSQSVV